MEAFRRRGDFDGQNDGLPRAELDSRDRAIPKRGRSKVGHRYESDT